MPAYCDRRHEEEMGFARQRWSFRTLVRSRGHRGRCALHFWRRLSRWRGTAGLALRLNSIRNVCAAPLVAGHGNRAMVIADHRLHNGEPEPGPLRFRRVYGVNSREHSSGVKPFPVSATSMRTFPSFSEVLSVNVPPAGMASGRSAPDLERAVEQVGVRVNVGQRFGQEQFRRDRGLRLR